MDGTAQHTQHTAHSTHLLNANAVCLERVTLQVEATDDLLGQRTAASLSEQREFSTQLHTYNDAAKCT